MSDTLHAEVDWVGRVLGVTLPQPQTGGDGLARAWPAIKASWQDASDEVDRQIGALQKLLRGAADSRLQPIAETGLNAMTAGYKVKLLAALHDMDRASDTDKPTVAPRVIKTASALRAHLQTDKRIAACDACPHLKITIGATLGDGLAAMVKALSQSLARATKEPTQ
jgi:hypothetical protein